MKNEELSNPLVFRRILLTIDADDPNSSVNAFRYAVTMAHDYGVDLHIVSVLEDDDINIFDAMTPGKINKKEDDVRQTVEDYVEEAKKTGVENVRGISVGAGDVDDLILDQVIPKFDPDLIVCGSDTEDASHRVPGAVGLRIARRAHVSVIVVR
ncbi:universal stress protein [Pediococcus argentinicus]|uniref:universal stress protein n=1 Tax=Pediococcus argentinicus TaxID=480391 RepID=UPI00338F623F